jgi:glyoxylase-like metal-dependent hydrolase (beta-lactamase superfamily II)
MPTTTWTPTRIDAELSFWLAPHFGWTPTRDDGTPTQWPEQVAAAALDREGAPFVLIDPIAPREPAEAAAFWAWVEARGRARRDVAILVSNRYHGRHAPQVLERFPAAHVYAIESVHGLVNLTVTDRLGDGGVAPGGIVARAIENMEDPEVAWHIPSSRALFFGDAVHGAGAGLKLPPATWCRDPAAFESVLVPSLRRLVALEAEHVIPSHGAFEPGGGVAKLRTALDEGQRRP